MNGPRHGHFSAPEGTARLYARHATEANPVDAAPALDQPQMDSNLAKCTPLRPHPHLTRLDKSPCQLSRAEPGPQRVRADVDRRGLRWIVGVDVGDSGHWLLAEPAAGGPGSRLPRPPVHDPARLRPWCFLPPPSPQRLGGPRHRHADADALRRLASQPRRPPRQLGQSRGARHRRYQHADRAGVPRLVALGPAGLSALPQPHRHVRAGPRLSVPRAAPVSERIDARRLAALAQHHGHQRGYRLWSSSA